MSQNNAISNPVNEELKEENLNLVLSDAELEQDEEEVETKPFDPDLIRKYPRSNRKVGILVAPYSLRDGEGVPPGQSMFISPHGVEFKTNQSFEEGTLLKIEVNLPDYWERKQRFVEYGRVDQPKNFKILAKVVKTENLGKRGKNKTVLAKTIVIDEVDEQVLKHYLQEG